MKKILITGAVGFIGYHLSLALRKRGDVVVGYDNFNDYYDPWLKKARNQRLVGSGVDVVCGDLCDKDLLLKTVAEHKITHIVNLAAQAGVRYSLKNPGAYLHSNLEGFLNVLEVVRAHPEIPLVYASSSSVYGLNEKVPFEVTDQCDNQASLYGATKKSNELMAFSYHHLYGIKTTGLRFFTVYGPWGRPDMAYYSFTKKILAGESIDVFNHGKMERDFTYIDDIVDGIVASIDLEANNEIFNLGNNQPVQLGRFIEIIEKSLGVEAKKNYLPMQAGDVPQTYADIEHSRRSLGFKPKISLEQGIPQFVQWYREHVDSEVVQQLDH